LRQAVSTPGKIGTVTSAVRYLAKAVLTGNVSTIVETSPRGLETLRGQITSDKGLGGADFARSGAGQRVPVS
jgi:hypothetical protein